jgi:hypothetical protein
VKIAENLTQLIIYTVLIVEKACTLHAMNAKLNIQIIILTVQIVERPTLETKQNIL